jgi:hypothetical protein
VSVVSELLPNLDALRKLLTGSSAANADALALIEAAATATSETELAGSLREAVEQWRRA